MFEPIKELNYIAITLLNINCDKLCTKLKETFSTKTIFDWDSNIGPFNIKNVFEGEQTISGAPKRRIAIWSLKDEPDKSVFLSNYADGCQTVINASLPESIDMIRISVSKYNVENFNKFEFRRNSKTRVILAYLNYDKWEFIEQGDIVSFENKEYYSRRLKKDRLNYEIINEYLEANGWYLNDEAFCASFKNDLFY